MRNTELNMIYIQIKRCYKKGSFNIIKKVFVTIVTKSPNKFCIKNYEECQNVRDVI